MTHTWGLPTPDNTITIQVRHACGDVVAYPFEGIETPEGYRMPQAEAERLAGLKQSNCIEHSDSLLDPACHHC